MIVTRIYPRVFRDHRGVFRDIRSVEDELNLRFLESDLSTSFKGVLRGLHGDDHSYKLLTCVHGLVYHVLADLKTKVWVPTEMNPEGPSVLVRPGQASGIYVLSETATILYEQTEAYRGAHEQFTIKWNDQDYDIQWPLKGLPITSKRDSA